MKDNFMEIEYEQIISTCKALQEELVLTDESMARKVLGISCTTYRKYKTKPVAELSELKDFMFLKLDRATQFKLRSLRKLCTDYCRMKE